MSRKQKPSPLETKHLVALGAGMLLPIPVIGEAVLAYGLYPIIKETGIIKNDPIMNSVTSLATAGLTRAYLYEPFYLPSLNLISEISRFF